MAEPFATHADLEDRWRTLSSAEQARADVLLKDASAIIRSLVRGIDARIASGALDEDVPKAIVCAMVKRVMQGPADLDGVSQTQQTAGPFSQGVSFANPSGDLYLTKGEKQRLGIGAQRAFSVDLLAVDDDSSSSSSSSSSS